MQPWFVACFVAKVGCTTVYVYDHVQFPSELTGLTEAEVDEYRSLFQAQPPMLNVDHDFAEFELARSVRSALPHDLQSVASPEDAELVIVALWEFGLCMLHHADNVTKWERGKGVLARSTCPSLVRFYRNLIVTPRFQRHQGRDFAFLLDKVWYKGMTVPREVATNALLVGVEERRKEHGASELVPVPYYVSRSKWAANFKDDKRLFVAWIGTLSVQNHCGTCGNADPGVVRRKVVTNIQDDCRILGEECATVAIDGMGHRNSPAILDEKTDMASLLRRARFCPVPRGDSAATKRFYCAIFALCVPVVVSDHLPLPFADVVNYSSFILRFSEADAVAGKLDHLALELRRIPEQRLVAMRAAMRRARDDLAFLAAGETESRRARAVANFLHDLHARFLQRQRATFYE